MSPHASDRDAAERQTLTMRSTRGRTATALANPHQLPAVVMDVARRADRGAEPARDDELDRADLGRLHRRTDGNRPVAARPFDPQTAAVDRLDMTS